MVMVMVMMVVMVTGTVPRIVVRCLSCRGWWGRRRRVWWTGRATWWTEGGVIIVMGVCLWVF